MATRTRAPRAAAAPSSETLPDPAAPTPVVPDELRAIAVAAIDPSPYQPRTMFDATELQQLADSMKASGLLQPISVRDGGAGRFELIAGERRWRAAQRLGWDVIPALVKSTSDAEAAALAAIENLQRSALGPLEEADAFVRLMGEHGWSQSELARRLGVPRATVGDRVRLLDLPPVWLDEIRAGTVLQVSHAAVLSPYGAAPDAVHVAAHAEAQKGWEWKEAAKEKRPLAVAAFRHVVVGAYRPHLCTLVTTGYNRCPFDPKEYSGTVVTVPPHVNAKPERMAADPAIWKPLAETARASESDSRSASTSQDARPVAKAILGHGERKREIAITLPKGTEIARVEWSHNKLPGATLLSTDQGRWDVEGALLGVDVPHLEATLAPGGLVAGKSVVLRVAHPYNAGVDRTATRDKAAVKAARQAYAARWDARRAELEAGYPEQLRVAREANVVAGPGARALLVALVGEDRWHCERALAIARMGASVNLAPPDAIFAKSKSVTGAGNTNALTREWLQSLSSSQVDELASAVAAQASGAIATPADAIEVMQRAERRAWSARPVPWIQGSGGEEPELDDEEDEDFDEDELWDEEGEGDEESPAEGEAAEEVPAGVTGGGQVAMCIDCGCTDDDACRPVTCHWLAVDYERGLGVCSTCAPTIADGQAKLDAYAAPTEGAARE